MNIKILITLSLATSLTYPMDYKDQKSESVKQSNLITKTPSPQEQKLLTAAANGDTHVVRELIKAGVNLLVRDADSVSALHYASSNGQIDCVELLVNADPTMIDITDNENMTPLMYAAASGYAHIVKFLINKKANIKARKSIENQIALHFAAYNGHLNCVELLVNADPTMIDATDKENRTPLMLAANEGHTSIVKFLISKKANIRARDINNETILHFAAHFKSNLDCFKLIFDADPVAINALDKENKTPLMNAAANGHTTIAKFLISKKAIIKARGIHNQTALHIAANNGHLPCVELLFNANPTLIDAVDQKNYTPLMRAAENGHSPIVNFLINNKANIKIQNIDKQTALHKTANNGHLDCFELLFNADTTMIDITGNENSTPLMLAAGKGHASVVKFLIDKKADIKARNIKNNTALHFAAYNGQVDCFKLLFNIDPTTTENHISLIFAAYRGHAHIVQFLIDKKTNVNAQNADNQTALFVAAKRGHHNVVKILLPLTQTEHKLKALIETIKNNNKLCFKYILGYLQGQDGQVQFPAIVNSAPHYLQLIHNVYVINALFKSIAAHQLDIFKDLIKHIKDLRIYNAQTLKMSKFTTNNIENSNKPKLQNPLQVGLAVRHNALTDQEKNNNCTIIMLILCFNNNLVHDLIPTEIFTHREFLKEIIAIPTGSIIKPQPAVSANGKYMAIA